MWSKSIYIRIKVRDEVELPHDKTLWFHTESASPCDMTRRRHQCTITLASRARRLVFRPICYIQHCREAPSSMQLSSKHTVFSHSADETPFNHHSIALLPIPYILVYASLVSSSLYTRYRFIHNLQTQDVRAACFAVSQPQKRRVAEFCGIYWRETGDRRCGMWRKAKDDDAARLLI